tara:strand:+ start:7602 stop:8246 length:645 start_codon:yes stop_codon:yes gene_type:complete
MRNKFAANSFSGECSLFKNHAKDANCIEDLGDNPRHRDVVYFNKKAVLKLAKETPEIFNRIKTAEFRWQKSNFYNRYFASDGFDWVDSMTKEFDARYASAALGRLSPQFNLETFNRACSIEDQLDNLVTSSKRSRDIFVEDLDTLHALVVKENSIFDCENRAPQIFNEDAVNKYSLANNKHTMFSNQNKQPKAQIMHLFNSLHNREVQSFSISS